MKFKMKKGDSPLLFADKFNSECPELHLTGDDDLCYLWVGGEKGPCYATLSGRSRLINLANQILKNCKKKEKGLNNDDSDF